MTNCETGLHHTQTADCHKAFTASWELVRRPGEARICPETAETAPGQTSGNHHPGDVTPARHAPHDWDNDKNTASCVWAGVLTTPSLA